MKKIAFVSGFTVSLILLIISIIMIPTTFQDLSSIRIRNPVAELIWISGILIGIAGIIFSILIYVNARISGIILLILGGATLTLGLISFFNDAMIYSVFLFLSGGITLYISFTEKPYDIDKVPEKRFHLFKDDIIRDLKARHIVDKGILKDNYFNRDLQFLKKANKIYLKILKSENLTREDREKIAVIQYDINEEIKKIKEKEGN